MGFHQGNQGLFGAVGHWGPNTFDLGYGNNGTDIFPTQGQWAHLAYTWDGSESRVFITYNETLGDLSTLAHELGHAFHGALMRDMRAWVRPQRQGTRLRLARSPVR